MFFVSALIIGNALVLEWKYTATVGFETRNGCASILYMEVKKYNSLLYDWLNKIIFNGIIVLLKLL